MRQDRIGANANVVISLAISGVLVAGSGAAYLKSYTPPTSVGRVNVGQGKAGVVGFEPTRLQYAVDGNVDAPVVPVSVDKAGAMTIPSNPKTLGWWTGGAKAGASEGTTVIVGHVDTASSGPGALYHLADMPLGDVITLQTAHGPVRYAATARQVYSKASLPQSIFDTKDNPRLVLITCGGEFNYSTGHYKSNVVVYADPVA